MIRGRRSLMLMIVAGALCAAPLALAQASIPREAPPPRQPVPLPPRVSADRDHAWFHPQAWEMEVTLDGVRVDRVVHVDTLAGEAWIATHDVKAGHYPRPKLVRRQGPYRIAWAA